MKQGDIHWLALGPSTGHQQAGRRPGIIIQADAYQGFRWTNVKKAEKMAANVPKWVGSELTVLGMTLGLCVVLPVVVGSWLGKKWGHESAGVLLGLALGIAAAARELYRTVQRLNRTPPKPRTESPHDSGNDGKS